RSHRRVPAFRTKGLVTICTLHQCRYIARHNEMTRVGRDVPNEGGGSKQKVFPINHRSTLLYFCGAIRIKTGHVEFSVRYEAWSLTSTVAVQSTAALKNQVNRR